MSKKYFGMTGSYAAKFERERIANSDASKAVVVGFDSSRGYYVESFTIESKRVMSDVSTVCVRSVAPNVWRSARNCKAPALQYAT